MPHGQPPWHRNGLHSGATGPAIVPTSTMFQRTKTATTAGITLSVGHGTTARAAACTEDLPRARGRQRVAGSCLDGIGELIVVARGRGPGPK